MGRGKRKRGLGRGVRNQYLGGVRNQYFSSSGKRCQSGGGRCQEPILFGAASQPRIVPAPSRTARRRRAPWTRPVARKCASPNIDPPRRTIAHQGSPEKVADFRRAQRPARKWRMWRIDPPVSPPDRDQALDPVAGRRSAGSVSWPELSQNLSA
jgi:hypothetical protein